MQIVWCLLHYQLEREKKQPLRFSDIWLSVKPKPTRESVNEL